MSASSSQIGIPAPATATQAGATDPDGNLAPLLVDADGALITSAGGSGSNASVGPTGDPVPASATLVGGTDGTDLRGIKVDASGELQVDVLSSALPTGAATEATLGTLNGKVPSGLTVTSTRLLVDASGTTQPISGTVTAVQATGSNLHIVVDSGTITTVSTVTAVTTVSTVSAVTAITNALPTGSNVIGGVTQSGTWNVGTITTITNTVPTKEIIASTATLTNVASSATSVTVLASNANRLGAMIFNDSTQVLFLKFGATASSSSYTTALGPGAYYELPTAHIYSGIIDGIWVSANGNARVTELTA